MDHALMWVEANRLYAYTSIWCARTSRTRRLSLISLQRKWDCPAAISLLWSIPLHNPRTSGPIPTMVANSILCVGRVARDRSVFQQAPWKLQSQREETHKDYPLLAYSLDGLSLMPMLVQSKCRSILSSVSS